MMANALSFMIKQHSINGKTASTPQAQHLKRIYKDLSGNLWGILGDTLYLFSTLKVNSPAYTKKYTIDDPLLRKPMCIYEDKKRRLWIGAEAGVGILNPATGQATFRGLKNQKVNVIYQDSRHTVWVGTNRGLYWLNEQTGKFIRFESNLQALESLGNRSVRCLHEGKSGALWIGTVGHGLYQLETKSRKFSLRKIYVRKNGKVNKTSFFWHIQTGKDSLLWLQTFNDNLVSFNRSTGQTKLYKHQRNTPKSISHQKITVIYKDKLNQVWVGTQNGINLVDESRGEFKRYYPASNGNSRIQAILEDAQGNIVVQVLHKGLYKYNPQKDSFEVYFPMNYQGDYRAMLIDRKNIVWTRVKKLRLVRLCLIDLASGKKTLLDFNPKININGLPYMYESKSGQIWLASYGGGLIKATKQPNQKISLKYYRKQQGLANNHLYGILEDVQGHLWISHDQGLSKFNPTTETFNNYTVNDGIQDAEFISDAFTQTKDGQMFFGGGEGLNTFYPSEILQDGFVPSVVLTDFKIFDQSMDIDTPNSPLNQTIHFAKKISLTYEQARSFSFEFAALSYVRSERNQYKVKLENYDNDWQKLVQWGLSS